MGKNISYFYKAYKKPDKPPVAKKTITCNPLLIAPALKLADCDKRLAKDVYLHTFRQNKNELMIGGKLINRTLNLRNKRRYSQNRYMIFAFVVNKNLSKHELIILPEEVDGEKTHIDTKGNPASFCQDKLLDVKNMLLGNSAQFHLIYFNQLGKVFIYNKNKKKWQYHSNLGFQVASAKMSKNDSCYLAFGSSKIYNEPDGLRKPTGILKYDFLSKSKTIILNNQKLDPQSTIESEKGFIIEKMIPLSDGNLYFLTEHLKKPSRRLHLFQADTKKITTLKTGDRGSMTLTENKEKILLYQSWNYFSNDFKSFSPSIDMSKYYYSPNLKKTPLKWQCNFSGQWITSTTSISSPFYGIAFPFNGGICKLDGKKTESFKNSTLPFNLHFLSFWRKNSFKQKSIPIHFTPTSNSSLHEGGDRIYAFIPDGNSVFLLGSIDGRKSGNKCSPGIWTLKMEEEIKDYYDKKLDFPCIFPYGWTYYPPEKKVSFWPKQKITMEDLGEGVEVRYTTDGSWPDENSKLYTKPFVIDKSMKIIARAFKKGMHASDPFIVSYTKKKKNNP